MNKAINHVLPVVMVLCMVSCVYSDSMRDTEDRLVAYSGWLYPLSDSTEACIIFEKDGTFHESLRESNTQDGDVYGEIDGKWSLEKTNGKYIIVQYYEMNSLRCEEDSACRVRAYYEEQNRLRKESKSEGVWYGIGPFSGFTEDGHIRLPDGRLFWSCGEEYAGDYDARYFETRR